MCMYFSTSINKHCGLPVIYLGNCECQFVNEVKADELDSLKKFCILSENVIFHE